MVNMTELDSPPSNWSTANTSWNIAFDRTLIDWPLLNKQFKGLKKLQKTFSNDSQDNDGKSHGLKVSLNNKIIWRHDLTP